MGDILFQRWLTFVNYCAPLNTLNLSYRKTINLIGTEHRVECCVVESWFGKVLLVSRGFDLGRAETLFKYITIQSIVFKMDFIGGKLVNAKRSLYRTTF